MEALHWTALIALTSFVLVGSLLTVLPAPPWRWAWISALVVTEYGHWLAVLPVGFAAVALLATDGVVAAGLVAANLAAALCLLRPLASGWRVLRAEGLPGYAWRQLYWRMEPRPVPLLSEEYSRPEGEPLLLDFHPAEGQPDPARPAPCLVVVHGGGWDGGHRRQLAEWNTIWARCGWAVATMSYRLAPRHRWPAQREDVEAALAWLRANARRLGIDPARLVLVGRSAGAQIATAVAFALRDPGIRGVVAIYGLFDMHFAWSIASSDQVLDSPQLMRQYLGGGPDTPERRALYDSASAQLLARADSPPTLLLHGLLDTLVWFRHSRRLQARMNELRGDCQKVELPWATHGFDVHPFGPGGQVTGRAIARFLRRVAPASPGAAQPAGEEARGAGVDDAKGAAPSLDAGAAEVLGVEK